MYVDLFDENFKQFTVDERPLVGATLKKIQADLESFALETENPEAKKMYTEQAKTLQKTLDQILPYLK